MRRAVVAVAAACLLVGPTVLAFFSGGYYAEPRLIAALVSWALVLALAVLGPAPLPRSRTGWLALGGLASITAWSAASLAWAPLSEPALASVQRLVLYLGALMLAVGVLRAPRALRAAEPVLAAGATVVIGYGLSGRLLPGLVELARSESAGGRLEQPLTYWNATGALAAMGLVLCARLAGDRTRPAAMRAVAAAAAAPLGAGLYLTFSRGAIAVAVLGLLVLVAAAPTRAQLRAAAVSLATGVAAAAGAAVFSGVASLDGALDARERDGAVVLAILVLLAGIAALLTARHARSTHGHDALPRSRLLGPAAAVAFAAAAAGLVVGGLGERPSEADLAAGADAGRLASATSNRYEYWRVGLEAFERRPLGGLGAGGFRVFWLKERSIPEAVRDVHSLPFEMAAELGVVGLLGFLVMVAGVAGAARRALRRHRALAAGASATALAWLLHASIDWDWQMPAVSLPAVVLAGALVALSETAPDRAVTRAAPRAGPAGAARRAPAGRQPDRGRA